MGGNFTRRIGLRSERSPTSHAATAPVSCAAINGDDDIILVSDVDEIPNLENLNFSDINHKIILFKQDMFYYKFNLKLPEYIWVGTKGCRKLLCSMMRKNL